MDGTELQDSSGNKKKSLEMKNSRCTLSKEGKGSHEELLLYIKDV